MDDVWEVYALKYADRNARTRRDSFIMADDHDAPHPIDYYVWALKQGDRVIVVDTGYDGVEARRRGRPIQRDPATALAALGVEAQDVDSVIITHLHYDHAGGLHRFPNAHFHLQTAEMAYATGPCMCDTALNHPFTVEHVCEMVRHAFSGRVIFHDGDAAVAPGVTVHRIGGHSRGLQAVRVKTASGWLCLASDAAHYYENYRKRSPFPILVDMEDMLRGFDLIQSLASDPGLVIPGHDPLVREIFPRASGAADFVWRLDRGPLRPVEDFGVQALQPTPTTGRRPA